MKRKLFIWTTVCFLIWSLSVPGFSVFAAETAHLESDLYHYSYQGDALKTSDHFFTFQWWYKDSPREPIRNRHHATNIFKMVNLNDREDQPAAYCSDFLYSIKSDTQYKRMNLEDSTYYNPAAARHIRSIMKNGYWYDWTSADLKAAEERANQWLKTYDSAAFHSDAFLPYDAEEEVNTISHLTAGEALMATQLAIWAFANTEGDDWWVKYHGSNLTETEGQYQPENLPENVKTFRKYLIHQQSQPLMPEDILFTDQYFVTDAVTFTGSLENPAVYDFILKVKLAAQIDSRDNLILTAVLSDGTSFAYPLSGQNKIQPDDNGYYTLQLNDVSKDVASCVSLTISGSQYADGIYFYEAKSQGESPRETSQNLVGKAAGMTPVQATVTLSYEVGTKSISLCKLDADTNLPLEGAVFDLYGAKDGESQLILQDLITDKKGTLSISNLPEGFSYHFVETQPPDGYMLDKDTASYSVDESGAVSVYNRKAPLPETEADSTPKPEIPETPVSPESPDENAPGTLKQDTSVDNDIPVSTVTPVKQPRPDLVEEAAPKTGDTSSLGIFLLLLSMSSGLFYYLLSKR